MRSRDREGVLVDPVRRGESRVDIAVLPNAMALHVRVRHGRARAAAEVRVAGRIWMEHRCLRRERRLGVQDRGKLLVLDVHGRRCGCRDLYGVRGDDGDTIADEEDSVPREERPILKAAPKPLRLRLRARQDRANSGHRAGPRQVDRYDPRVRKRTRDIRGVEHARANDVRRKTGRAGDLVAPLDPVLGLPEDRRRRLGDAGHRIT